MNIKSTVPHIAVLVSFLLIAIIYFLPQVQGKTISKGDVSNFEAMSYEMKQVKEKEGSYPYWTNSIFGGMPSYQIVAQHPGNLLKYVLKVMKLGFQRPIGHFFMGMICFYILMLCMGVKHWLAGIMSVAFAFTTNNIILYDTGHVTKVATIMTAPLVIAGMITIFKKRYILGVFLFGAGLGVNIFSNHIQMSYYLSLILFILVLIHVVNLVIEKEYTQLTKSIGALALGSMLALGAAFSNIYTTYEYGEDTMRGKAILSGEEGKGSSSAVKGLDWDYAMRWSNGYRDLWASYIPNAVGGGSSATLPKNSETYKFFKKRGVNINKVAPGISYFGKLPSTSGPIYFGAALFFLFFLGMFISKNSIKWWILSSVIITFIFSLGNNAELINRSFFDYFPLFNKFRTPNSVLSVTAILIPLMAGLTLKELLENRDNVSIKSFFFGAGSFAGITLLVALLGTSFMDLTGPSDSVLSQNGFDLDMLQNDRAAMLRSSALRVLGSILVLSILIYFYLKGKLNFIVFGAVAGIFVIGELMYENQKYIAHDDFQSKRKLDRAIAPRNVDKQIMQDADPYYRVYDTTVNTFNNSQGAYYHKLIGGYHAAKLQRYHDVIYKHIVNGNMKVLNMLNTKYIIQNPEAPTAQQNPAALGNAWFVNNIKIVPSADAEIAALNDFDPLGDAIVHKEFSDYVSNAEYQKQGTISLSSYHPEKLVYQTNASSDQFAVFSEIWYGPDKGWKASIDGQSVEHIRVNYLLRGLKIPSGKHEVVFEFDPSSVKMSSMVSYISSALIILLGLYLAYLAFTNKKGIATEKA